MLKIDLKMLNSKAVTLDVAGITTDHYVSYSSAYLYLHIKGII